MRSVRVCPLAISCLFVLLLSGLIGGCSGSDPGPELWVIGLDGADWDQLDPMIARGELPNIAALRDGGASGILLSDKPMISPILWTSIATGKTPDQHGVTWFMTDAPDGAKVPISSEERKVRAFWNIASEAGMTCGITGWWATWPAEPLNGYLISDAVAWHSFGVSGRSHPSEGKTWPWELVTEIEPLMPDPAVFGDDLMTRLIHKPAAALRYDPDSGTYENPINHLRQALATSRGFTDLTLARLDKERPRVMSVYYEGTDAVTHLFGRFQEPRLSWVPEADFQAYKDVVDEYWRWQDELLGELLAERGPETTILVISDHGFRRGAERRKEDHFQIETADNDHQPDGVVILNGPGVKTGARIEGADIYDVTPTILYLLDLPVGRDMAGHPLTDALQDETLRSHPVQWVATHETGAWDRGSSVAADGRGGEDLEKMLRSLGYIAGAEGGGETVEAGTTEQAVNLAVVLMNQGRTGEAVQLLTDLGQQHPGVYEVSLNLAQALARDGRKAASDSIYEILLEDYPDRKEVREDYGMSLRLTGDFQRADQVYAAGLDEDPDWVRGLAGRGLCLAHLGRPAEGRRMLEEARRRDPSDPKVHWNLGQVLRNTGDQQGAMASFRKALQLEPTDYHAAAALADVQCGAGQFDAAERVLKQALAKGADRAHLLGALGAAQLQGGKTAEARESLREAHKLNPGDRGILGNLGMAQAMGGDLDKAIGTFEDLVKMAPDMADAHAQLGAMQMQSGRHEAGLTSLRRAVELAPANSAFRMNLGYALQMVGRNQEAEEQFRKARE